MPINETARGLDSDRDCQTPTKLTQNQERLQKITQAEESDEEDDDDSDESGNDLEMAQDLDEKAEESDQDETKGLDAFQLARLER